MQGVFDLWRRRMALLFVPAAVMVLGPTLARADLRPSRYFEDDVAGDLGGGGDDLEGDPLDSNDSSGDSIDPRYDYHDGADGGVIKPGRRGLPRIGSFYLVPVYQGGLLTFRIVTIDNPGTVGED